jgi:hypothetical protein
MTLLRPDPDPQHPLSFKCLNEDAIVVLDSHPWLDYPKFSKLAIVPNVVFGKLKNFPDGLQEGKDSVRGRSEPELPRGRHVALLCY